jgi:hypothetical protein
MAMIEENSERPEVHYSRITPQGSWLVRRICAVLVAAWLGGMLLVSLSAPAVFGAAEVLLRHPLPAHAAAIQKIGADAMADLLRYHAGEVNNQIFALWGWMQVAYGIALVLLLLFFTNVGKWRLGLAAAMLVLALFQRLYLIPAIADTSRRFRAGGWREMGNRFQLLHGSFATFEIASALLGLTLLVLLLRSSRGGSRRRASF